MSEARFDISLPLPYEAKWREAYRSEKDDSPRLSSYQAPDGEPIPFIYKNLDFSGGQSVDTAEYPFFGLWSNETLNKKAQSITVHGYLRGEYYIQQRLDFLDALTVSTSDDSPGFFDHPLWGRFKVVLESYNIQEAANENGQCEISLTFKRAGVSLDKRIQALDFNELIKPEETALVAVEIFSEIDADAHFMSNGFGILKKKLLEITGSLQMPQNMLNSVLNEITGITNLISQGIQVPMQFAQALINTGFAIVSAVLSVGEAMQSIGKYFSGKNNKKDAALKFLSAYNWTLPLQASTVRQYNTQKAIENLYRIVSLCVSAKILSEMEEESRERMDGFLKLYDKLETSVNLENPDIYQAVMEMRTSLSVKIRQSSLARELSKRIETPIPILLLSHYLGCDEYQLRRMNDIENSFLISGEVTYV